MNRIFNSNPYFPNNPLQRPGRELRQKTETILRDLAYVLHLTRRVKEQLMEEKKETVGV